MIASAEKLGRRIDLHMHSLLSDGDLLPSEIAQRACRMGYKAIAITDHVDASNLDFVARRTIRVFDSLRKHLDLIMIPGVELTHVPPADIASIARKVKKLGISLVVVHGETPVETVMGGTNKAALSCSDVDILAHPGLISVDEAQLARENGICLELTTRRGHVRANGHVAKVAMETKCKLLLNTDLHSAEEFLSQEAAFKATLGSGLSEGEALKVVRDYPREILKKIGV